MFIANISTEEKFNSCMWSACGPARTENYGDVWQLLNKLISSSDLKFRWEDKATDLFIVYHLGTQLLSGALDPTDFVILPVTTYGTTPHALVMDDNMIKVGAAGPPPMSVGFRQDSKRETMAHPELIQQYANDLERYNDLHRDQTYRALLILQTRANRSFHGAIVARCYEPDVWENRHQRFGYTPE